MRFLKFFGFLTLVSLGACADYGQRTNCNDPAVNVVHDHGGGQFGNGKFCYKPR